MSRLSRDRDSLVDHARVLLLSGFASGAAEPTAATSAAWTVTYTTDNPNTVVNRAITIADGDTMSNAEHYEAIDEIKSALNKASVDARACITAVAALIGDNVYDVTLADMTMGANSSSTRHIGFTFTTDNPSLTADGTVTIADGDLTTAAEFLQFAQEASWELAILRGDIGKVHSRLQRVIQQRSFAGVDTVPSLSAVTFVVTYTTDNPNVTPGATTTIADGDGAISVAERNDVIAEVKDQLNKTKADIASARTAFNAWLALADIA
jgi:hypothetical protein